MIRALRERHRRTMVLLAATLPLGYLALLLARSPGAHSMPLPPADRGDRHPVGAEVALLPSPRLTAQLLADSGASAPSAVVVTPTADPGIPDLLLYWAPTAGAGAALPPDAFLIGALRGSRQQVLPLPEPGMMAGGHFILYGAVQHQVLGDTPLPATP